MADAAKTVAIIFGGVDNLSPVAKQVAMNLDAVSGAVDHLAAPLAGAADGVLALDSALAALAAGSIVLAVREAGKFHGQFAEISTMVDATGGALDAFKERVKVYGRESTQSIEAVTGSIYTAISAGVDYKDSLALVGQAEKLAVAGKADLQSVTNVLASTLNAYGESASKAGKYSDVFFQTVKIGQTTIPELSASLAEVTGIAASADVPIEMLGAAIAALTASGVKTPQAITAIKAALSNIIKPSSEAAELAGQLGVRFDAAALRTRGFEGVLKDAWTATKGNVDQMAKLFGSVEALNAVLPLAADKGGKFADAMTAMRTASGSTAAAFAKMQDDVALATQRLSNNVRLTLADLGEPLLNRFGGSLSGLSEVVKGLDFSFKAGAFDDLYQALDAFWARFNDFLKALASAMPDALEQVDFGVITRALADLGGEFAGLFDGLDLGKPDDLARALQGVANGVAALIRVTAGMVESFQVVVDAAVNGAGAFSQLDEASQKGAGNILGAAKLVAVAGLEVAAGVVAISAAGQDLLPVMQVISGGLQIVWNAFTVVFRDIELALATLARAGLGLLEALSFGALDFSASKAELRSLSEEYEQGILQDIQDAEDGLARMGRGFGVVAAEGKAAAKTVAVEFEGLRRETEKPLGVVLEPDMASVAATKQAVDFAAPDVKKVQVVFEDGVAVITGPRNSRPPEVVKTKVEIDKESERKFKEQSETLRTALELKSKSDVAVIEAESRKVQAAFESIGRSVDSTGDLIGGLLKDFAQMDTFQQLEIAPHIEREAKNRSALIAEQIDLTRAQAEALKAQTAALGRGESIIKIDGTRLAPELEAFMFKILEAIQVKATGEGQAFLAGLGRLA